jgi:hypothetical protein
MCLELGFDKKLHNLVTYRIDELSLAFLGHITWAFANICQHKNENLSNEVVDRFYADLFKLIMRSATVEVLKDAIFALAYLFRDSEHARNLAASKVVI